MTLNRRDRLIETISKNKHWMDTALAVLDENLNKTSSRISKSPSYQRNKMKE